MENAEIKTKDKIDLILNKIIKICFVIWVIFILGGFIFYFTFDWNYKGLDFLLFSVLMPTIFVFFFSLILKIARIVYKKAKI